MIKFFIEKFKGLEKDVVKIIQVGLKFSLIVCLIATGILLAYETFFSNPTLYYIGLKLLQTGAMFAAEFGICGLAIDTIRKQMA